jgi:uncharacterized Zn-binding protein involved in type VI secretion
MGKPAARVGDIHTCPMVTPGTPPVPHVGGPILPPGCPTVLIGGTPAARMGDMATCVGPPDWFCYGTYWWTTGSTNGRSDSPWRHYYFRISTGTYRRIN